MVFLWSLSDSRCPQVSRTLLSILADLNNASSSPLIFKCSRLFTNPLGTVQSTTIIINFAVTFMFYSFFFFCFYFLVFQQGLGIYISFLFFKRIYSCSLPERQISLFGRISFLLLTVTKSGRLAEIR